MKTKSRGKKTTSAKGAVPCQPSKPFRFERTLLIYPVLVVAALAILIGVRRSIQRELEIEPRALQVVPAEEVGPNESETALSGAGTTATELTTDREQGPATLPDAQYTSTPADDTTEGQTRPIWAEAQELRGAADVLARLHKATRAGDDAQIKRCMDELMALGDDAVALLGDVAANGTDATALWAAKALAQIGTPLASTVLLDTLAQTIDGAYKEQLVREASNISNHDSWPTLLNALQDTTDAAVQRAAGTSLTRMADRPVIDEIVARYDAAATEEEANRLAQMLGNITSPAAGESLLALAGSVSAAPQDGLERAAIHALGNIGDAQCVSYLLQKLESSPPGQGASLFNTITSINQPQAEAALRYAAAGSKEVSAEQGRTAAIYALENFPNERTYALLEEIVATEVNASVVSAAARTLDNIRNAEPVVAVNAAAEVHESLLLPSDPLQK